MSTKDQVHAVYREERDLPPDSEIDIDDYYEWWDEKYDQICGNKNRIETQNGLAHIDEFYDTILAQHRKEQG